MDEEETNVWEKGFSNPNGGVPRDPKKKAESKEDEYPRGNTG